MSKDNRTELVQYGFSWPLTVRDEVRLSVSVFCYYCMFVCSVETRIDMCSKRKTKTKLNTTITKLPLGVVDLISRTCPLETQDNQYEIRICFPSSNAITRGIESKLGGEAGGEG